MIVLDVLRIFFGAMFILFLPGFVWSFVFFKREIDLVERLALSFGLSIAIVPSAVFWLNWLLHVRITLLNTGLTVGALTILPACYLLVKTPSLRRSTTLRLRMLFKRNKG